GGRTRRARRRGRPPRALLHRLDLGERPGQLLLGGAQLLALLGERLLGARELGAQARHPVLGGARPRLGQGPLHRPLPAPRLLLLDRALGGARWRLVRVRDQRRQRRGAERRLEPGRRALLGQLARRVGIPRAGRRQRLQSGAHPPQHRLVGAVTVLRQGGGGALVQARQELALLIPRVSLARAHAAPAV